MVGPIMYPSLKEYPLGRLIGVPRIPPETKSLSVVLAKLVEERLVEDRSVEVKLEDVKLADVKFCDDKSVEDKF
jgi:hypothetical protein